MNNKLNLKIPKNLTEKELLDTIRIVAKKHIKNYSFPGHTEEDMMQLAIMYGINASHKWDGKRPLKNFLGISIRNALYNYKRKHYMRMEIPCLKCPLKAYIKPNKCELYQNRNDCALFDNWEKSNIERQNINNAIGFDVVSDVEEDSMKLDMDIDLDREELMQLLDENIDIAFRQDYLTYMNGGRLGHKRQAELFAHIEEIIWPSEKPEL